MIFNGNMAWKCVQVNDWKNICVLNMVNFKYSINAWVALKVCSVHKYGIYKKSMYFTWFTWDLTEIWPENVSKYMIEKISVYLTW